MLEVELKVQVPSLDPIRAQLLSLGAEARGRVHEHDIYYNAPHRDFGSTDEALRVRYTGDNAVLTYKGAKVPAFGLKAREELNTALEHGEVFETVLQRLGFARAAEVDKWRENFRYNGAAISLDEVDELGTFVEIELIAEEDDTGAASRIGTIAKEMGVTGEPILASYLELLLAKRADKRE